MSHLSRRNTRHFLLSALYMDAFVSKEHSVMIFAKTNKNQEIVSEVYMNESENTDDELSKIDWDFFYSLREIIYQKQSELQAIIATLAPKFILEKIPKIHVIILMMAIAEILYGEEKLHEKIVINEAVELGKEFSDKQGASFINAVLMNFWNNQEKFTNISPLDNHFFC